MYQEFKRSEYLEVGPLGGDGPMRTLSSKMDGFTRELTDQWVGLGVTVVKASSLWHAYSISPCDAIQHVVM